MACEALEHKTCHVQFSVCSFLLFIRTSIVFVCGKCSISTSLVQPVFNVASSNASYREEVELDLE